MKTRNEGEPEMVVSSKRKLIKGFGAAALGGGALAITQGIGATPVGASTTDDAYDAIIIGAGFTGVTAARDLGQQGYKVLVLEAQNRIGGRTFSSDFDGHKVEMGGTWIHWAQPHIWSEVTRYDVELEEMPTIERMMVSDGGPGVDINLPEVFPAVVQTLMQVFHDAQAIWNRPYDQSFTWDAIAQLDGLTLKDRLDEVGAAGESRAVLEAQFVAIAQQPVEEISYVEMARIYALAGWNFQVFSDAMSKYKFKDGTKALLETMLADAECELKLSHVVTNVNETGDGVVITTEDGAQHHGKSVIVTVPFNTLKDVTFEPPLSAARQELAEEGMGTRGYKTFIEVEGDLGSVVGAAPEETMLPMFFTYERKGDTTLLVGFGTRFEEFDPNDTAAASEAIGKFFPDVVVRNVYGYAWSLDPFAQGFHGIYRNGQLARIKDEFTNVDGRVIVTGADHAQGWRGFIDGAVAAGSKAARHVDVTLKGA